MPAKSYVGQNRGREQHKRVCKGGPWDGQEAVLPLQEGGIGDIAGWSMVIRVGSHVGQYNLNTGEWREKK